MKEIAGWNLYEQQDGSWVIPDGEYEFVFSNYDSAARFACNNRRNVR